VIISDVTPVITDIMTDTMQIKDDNVSKEIKYQRFTLPVRRKSLYIKRSKVSVTYVRNSGRGQLSSE